MLPRLKTIFFLLLLWFPLSGVSQVVINELMQSNIDCIMDDINEFPDSWVELYNMGSKAVSLSEYGLGATADDSVAWQLPARQIAPKGYAIIYCDKQGQGLHTDFRIDSGKDAAVYLFHQGAVADQVTGLAKQPAPNISWGRRTDGDGEWGYQYSPTPQKSNCGTLCQQLLGEPVFSEPGRVMTGKASLQLTLSLPEGSPEGTVIRYTTDGSEPISTSTIYNAPLIINTTRIIRAKLFCAGYLSPRSTTQSYIFFPRDFTLPVISIVTDNKYLNDNKIGIYVAGNYKNGQKNYSFNWRRPINFEFFLHEGMESDINQLCETRIQGGVSRDCALKSLVVYAHKRFGKKRLKYEFFPDQRPGVTDFKSILLRNAGNDFDYLYMRDAIIQRTMGQHTDLDWQAWRLAVVYINGIYKGILNIRERSTADNIYTNHDGLEDIDMIEKFNEVKEGDIKSWEEFTTFYSEKGHTLDEFAQWIDWKEFINLMVMNLYFNNQDFPGNNIVMWRPRSEGGLWRFVAKDTDFGIGLYGTQASYNTIEWIYNPNYDRDHAWANQYEHTRLFRRMMDDADFRREFIDHATVYMGDFLNSDGVREIWDPMYEMIRYEYPNHRKLFNAWWPNYATELDQAHKWLSSRTNYFYNQLADYYQLGTPIPVQVNVNAAKSDLEAVDFAINGVRLSKSTYDGKFFPNRSYTLTSTPVNGRQVRGWRMVTVTNSGTKVTEVQGSTFDFEMPACKAIIIDALFGNDDGIDDLALRSWRWRIDGRRIRVEGVGHGTRVMLCDTRGIVLRQQMAREGDIDFDLPPTPQTYILKVGHEAIKIR